MNIRIKKRALAEAQDGTNMNMVKFTSSDFLLEKLLV